MAVFRGIDRYLGLLLFEIRRFEEEFKIPPERTEAIKALVTDMLLAEDIYEEEIIALSKKDSKLLWH